MPESRFVHLKVFVKNNLHLIFGSFVFAISLAFFSKILEEVIRNETIVLFDHQIGNLVVAHRTKELNFAMLAVTQLGSTKIIFALLVSFFLIMLKMRHIAYSVLLLISVICGGFFVVFVKNVVLRSRPDLLDALVHESSYSFPSGHSFIAISMYGMLAYIIVVNLKNIALRILTVLVGSLLILLIGFSRIYLGAHWLSDVLASFFAGLAWITMLILLFENRDRLRSRFN